MKKIRIILLILMAFPLNVLAEYYEIRTSNFKIIYDKVLEEQAVELSKKADEIAKNMYDFYKFESKRKYNVFLRNNSDIENCYTMYDTIILYPNQIQSNIIEKNYKNWIEYSFIHELTHLILNNKSGGVIGKSYIMKPILHTMFIPAWLQEGASIYSETKFIDGGRGDSDYFKMYLTAAIDEDKFKGLGMAGSIEAGKEMPYYYGYSFIDFYTSVYGEEKLREALDIFSRNQIEGFIKAADKSKKTKEIIENWKKWAAKEYKSGEGSREGDSVYESFGKKYNLILNERKLYFAAVNQKEKNSEEGEKGIYSYDIEEKKITKEIGIEPAGNFKIKDGKIWYSMIIPDFIRGIYLAKGYEKEIGKLFSTKYSKIERVIKFFDFKNRDGVVIREKGKEELRFADGEVIIKGESGFHYEKIEGDGEKLYFSASKDGETGNYLYSFDYLTKELKKITKGRSPAIFENYIYFSDNREGIFNIFRINKENGEIDQITDVKYGAFEPVPDRKGNIYYLNYRSKGFQIYKTSCDSIGKIEKSKSIELEKISNEIKSENKVKKIKTENLFRDGVVVRSGIVTPSNIVLNISNKFLEKNLVLIAGEIEYRNQEVKEYGIFSESKNKESGLAAAYIHANGGMPIFIGYAETIKNAQDYGSATVVLPYFIDKNRLMVIAKAEIDSNGEKSTGISLFGAAGYNFKHDKDSVNLNELYLKTEKLKVSYYFSDKEAEIEDTLFEQLIFNFKSSFKNIGYRIKTKDGLVVRALIDKKWNIDKGSITGRTVVKSGRIGVENLYTKWEYEEESRKDYAANFFAELDFYFNYNIAVSAAAGIIEQYDLKRGEHKEGEEIPYFKIGITF